MTYLDICIIMIMYIQFHHKAEHGHQPKCLICSDMELQVLHSLNDSLLFSPFRVFMFHVKLMCFFARHCTIKYALLFKFKY